MGNNDDNTLEIPRAKFELRHMFILWSYVHNLFQFGVMINRWMKWDFLLRKKCIAFCAFRKLWPVSHTLLPNTCSKLKIETLYWYAECGQSQQ